MVGMNDRTAELPGVGRTRAAALAKLGILTARDLLYHFPRGYQDRGNILSLLGCPDGTVGAFILTVASAPSSARISGGRYLTKFSAYDDSASVGIVYFNQPYVRDIFRVGATFRFWGRLSYSGGRAQLISPLFEPAGETVAGACSRLSAYSRHIEQADIRTGKVTARLRLLV